MNSLWDFEDGFSIPQDSTEVHIGGAYWLPVTPAKPAPPRSHATPIHQTESPLGKPNWPEFALPSNGYLHEIPNCSTNPVQVSNQCQKPPQTEEFFGLDFDYVERNQTTNQTVGPYTQALSIGSPAFGSGSLSDILASGDAAFIPSVEESLTRSFGVENEALDLNFPAVPSGWSNLNAGSILPATENTFSKDQLTTDCQYATPTSSQAMYDLNSTPRREVESNHASGIANPIQLAPITPDQARSGNPQLPVLNFLADESVNQEKRNGIEKSVSFTGIEAANPNSDELLQNIVDSFKQKEGTQNGTDEGIDLNRTPQQRTPKRKKHRPKVIREGKAKRAKTSQTPEKPNSASGNPSGKRKYVRKKGLNGTPVAPQAEDARETGPAKQGNFMKSARRALNFDLEEAVAEARTVAGREQRTKQADTAEAVNLVLRTQTTEPSTRANFLLGTTGTSVLEVAQQNRLPTQYRQGSMHGIASASTGRSSAPSFPFPQLQAAIQQRTATNHRQLGGDVTFASAHSERALGVGVGCSNSFLEQISPTQQHINKTGVRQSMFHPKSNIQNLTNSRQVFLNRFSQAASNVTRDRGLLNGQTPQSISTVAMWQHIVSTLSEAQRKTNAERISRVSPIVEDSRQNHMRGPHSDITSTTLTAQRNHEISRSYAADEFNQLLRNGYLQSVALRQQQALFEQQVHSIRREESGILSQMNRGGSIVVENHPHRQLIRSAPDIPGNKQNNTSISAMMSPVQTKLKTIKSKRNAPRSPAERRGSTTAMKETGLTTIDEIIHRLSNLHLGGEEGAIVPYRGDGTIVPFEGKKRKPRPKVDLDPETNRIWNLLMGKEKSQGLEENNQEKEKWWENEREVFRGRANSFIARMHLVQGDRRFSRWKGSVVDSVIGVFLTQNVSDHLSSSAFISLAARFPLKSTCMNTPCDRGKNKILVEEPEEFTMNTSGAFDLGTNLQLVCNRSPVAIHSTRESWRDGEISGTERANVFELQTQCLEEEVISSQGSFDCSTVDGSGGIRSYSGSNSESEDLGVSHKSEGVHRSASRTSLPGERFMFQDLNNQANGSTSQNHGSESGYEEPNNKRYANGSSANTPPFTFDSRNTYLGHLPTSPCHLQMAAELRVRNYDVFGEESTRSLSKASTFSGDREANGTAKQSKHPPESTSRSTVHEKGVLTSEQTQMMGRYTAGDKNQLYQRCCSQTGSQSGVTLQSILENTTVEPNSNDLFSSSTKMYKEETNAKQAKPKGAKPQVEKKIDWDHLRKDAQAKGARRERSGDAMDSLDYEAMRQASIKEISETIKERGMNNMLAERIKDFLNRLVEEHESIDLEWLRDVPPDKAKDYLLSIRGLGLKSVECVRLLTLHHLAFPVDTNVGRIAVRLGWVPLQPLPESLQLHLLELYPVLESIQKYLWPRLCKLDQRTLYELHYQLITFGKVFCTKSKPNCNACPMRGECRHFASAFASARLALPGPEDKSIVSSTVPVAESSNSACINPVPLHPLENYSAKEGKSEGANSQPIIEEPASPEQERAVQESDIEDGWYEDDDDDDEIPTIKLNMEEFTENLQNFIQDNNMELQEGDMSKALVALNPGVASIPTRKLKNVSRLRTEHQVYELPDDHPLLEGMQKREPDDPSPYLLAIWTPGETANSVHPPEQRCPFQDTGKLCNEKTCFSCNSIREANSQTVRGTLLIPCRTAMKGSFPLNGTYFQVNEMFADHDTSVNPIDVPRSTIWNLRRRTVYFGTSVTSIFRGLTTEEIQFCFWKGFVCVRGFERGTRAPRPLVARLHFPASKLAKTKGENNDGKG
ncbi:transcriptional activator DEMETER-like isoform X2 [Punica granatum]|uniref:Transcriptional activator DEMETER-like isoform X2 n=2 Tax=Punica granatum TaxID=22663 RepID=A0A6P8BXA5_PUNGR|nr:transcriptional activator DEMETER-like isoform X2 [Punica granatum]